VRLSYRELDARVDRIARGLVSLGVGRSDVVTFQLPNCWEFIALSLACVRIGAVANPVMPIFRQHELNFMLNFGESKVFVVPKVFRGFDYEAMARHAGRSAPPAPPGGAGRRRGEQLRVRPDARRYPARRGPWPGA
jgi:cyclohexanecarboxylate-CoA ligase